MNEECIDKKSNLTNNSNNTEIRSFKLDKTTINKYFWSKNHPNNVLLHKDVEKEDDPISAEKAENTLFFWKIFAITFIIVCGLGTITFYDQMKRIFIEFIKYFKTHIILGSLILIGIKIMGTILYVPGVLLAIGTGYAFKQVFKNYFICVPCGVITYMIGSVLGCFIVFSLSRLLLKGMLFPLFSKLKAFRALDRVLVKKGWKINILLRMSPIIPYNIMNYLLGVTSTSMTDYLIGLSGFIPLVICYIFMGATIDDFTNYTLSKNNKVMELMILIISIIMSIICILIITKIAKNELDNELIKEEENTAIKNNSEV